MTDVGIGAIVALLVTACIAGTAVYDGHVEVMEQLANERAGQVANAELGHERQMLESRLRLCAQVTRLLDAERTRAPAATVDGELAFVRKLRRSVSACRVRPYMAKLIFFADRSSKVSWVFVAAAVAALLMIIAGSWRLHRVRRENQTLQARSDQLSKRLADLERYYFTEKTGVPPKSDGLEQNAGSDQVEIRKGSWLRRFHERSAARS